MRLVLGRNAFPAHLPPAVVTIGMFDGVHRAHQRLVRTAVSLAQRFRAPSVAVTFDPDPEYVLQPDRPVQSLMPLARRAELLGDLGIEIVWVIRFTPSFARVPAEAFVRDVLHRRLRARIIVVGEAFAFGRSRRGDLPLLRALGHRIGMRVVAVPTVRVGGERVSSSRIKRLIEAGELTGAARLLSRPPELSGVVVHGSGRGRRIGVPTANLRVQDAVWPPTGVYAVRMQHRARRFRGVMNLGVRPTFGGGPLTCEVHLFDAHPRLYGQTVRVELLRRLRNERRFRAPAALASQIARDIAQTRRLLSV